MVYLIYNYLIYIKNRISRRLEYTIQYYFLILKNRLLVALLQNKIFKANSDLDPRSPISITSISNDITIPSVINEAGQQVSVLSLVIRALGLPRSLAL